MVKYIIVTGGVLSGLGKGIVTASIGNLLKGQGYKVSPVKIDPYINIDAGTMRPTEHGEVWVTPDGGETDQDLGNYERFMDIEISKDNNLTTGKIYSSVIQKERNLEYKGKCVQVIPHIPIEIKDKLEAISIRDKSDFVLIELGGVVGDYENLVYLEAMRRLKLEKNDIVFVHTVYLPVPGNLGEMKTKPAQHSIRELNSAGIQPDFIICRGPQAVDEVRRKKISLSCNVPFESVFSSQDISNIYEIPLILENQGLASKILEKINLDYKTGNMQKWQDIVSKANSAKESVKIGIVGKYFDIGSFNLEDSYISVIESIKHASWNQGLKPEISWLDSKDFENGDCNEIDSYDGIIVPGGFGKTGVEGKINAIKYARLNNIPYLGLCYGMQLAVVEFARNVCGLDMAHSTEVVDNCECPVIDIMDEQKSKILNNDYGATMRLGSYPAELKEDTKVQKLYEKEKVWERHRHRYEVNNNYIKILQDNGLVFSGFSPDRSLMEFMELPKHKFFVATQAHPEFSSRLTRPNPLFNGFIKASASK
ncbi:MAG: glutamine hydrolyzing CTP synthase [Nanobdellota archaeon]